MKRFALPAIAVLLLAGCAGEPPIDDLPPAEPPMFGESEALGLVNLWRVADAAGEADETWLRLDAHEFQLWRDCGMIMGSWRASDSLFLASTNSASGECATETIPVVEWLESATSFTETADGYELRANDGEVLSSLTIDGAPEPIDTAAEFYTQPPEITDEVRVQFAAPAELPSELEAAKADALTGKWVPTTSAPTDPHVVFEPDGTWIGSDGCNGGSGRWAVSSTGEFLATSGPSTLMFCEGAPVPSWVAQASAAGIDADGQLHLFDAAGAALGVLTR
jgi:heat shock protein HslJ